jgi:hypothetical protein
VANTVEQVVRNVYTPSLKSHTAGYLLVKAAEYLANGDNLMCEYMLGKAAWTLKVDRRYGES